MFLLLFQLVYTPFQVSRMVLLALDLTSQTFSPSYRCMRVPTARLLGYCSFMYLALLNVESKMAGFETRELLEE